MSKPFKTYEEQIRILKDRNLTITDEKRVESILELEGYFNVINGYKDIFLEQRQPIEKYIAEANFFDIANLFYFDRSLKANTLITILKIENSLKSIIAYEFAKVHGENGYKYHNNYSDSSKLRNEISTFIIRCTEKINTLESDETSKSAVVRHYKKLHSGLPIWILTNYLTFGSVSYFYTLLQSKTKTNIVNHINKACNCNLNSQDVATYLRRLVEIRNICAHNNRLYNYTSRVSLRKDNFALSKLNIENTDSRCMNLNIIIVIFYDLLNKSDFVFYCKTIASEISNKNLTKPFISNKLIKI